MYRRLFKNFNPSLFVDEVKSSAALQKEDVNASLNIFIDTLRKIVENHAPLRKRSIDFNSAPWLDEELMSLMRQKGQCQRSGLQI